jgi:hypothetical protein
MVKDKSANPIMPGPDLGVGNRDDDQCGFLGGSVRIGWDIELLGFDASSEVWAVG